MPDETVTKRDLEALEGKLDGKLGAFESRLDGKLEALEARLDGKLDAVEARMGDQVREAIRDSETRILKAIYEISESGNKRMIALERSDIGLIERFATLETRILNIEKRLNLPPAA